VKKIMLLAVIAVLVSSGGSARAEGVYLQAGGVGTKITSLPFIIKQPGYYYFGDSLKIALTAAPNAAITIDADNVTLDLMGFSLANTNPSAAGYGIYITGQKNVEVRNGTIENFQEGLQETSTSGVNHRALNLRLVRNGDGIMLRGNNHLVKNCTASNNGYGIFITGGTISNCVACDNSNTGIGLIGPGSVIGNIAHNNTQKNFSLGLAGTNTFITVNRNSASGLPKNYYQPAGSTGVVISTLNAGQP
jgi:hypothetical protein